MSWLKEMEFIIRNSLMFHLLEKLRSRKIGTGNYKNGKREGSWIGYYDNGQLMYKGNWKNGKREGSWVSYWNSGKLKDKGIYKNNIKISD